MSIDEEFEGMSAEEARDAVEAGELGVLDLRSEEAVAEGAIPGAVKASRDDLDEKVAAVRGDAGDAAVLLICPGGVMSKELAGNLRQRGIDATYLDGGFPSWESAGYDTEPGRVD